VALAKALLALTALVLASAAAAVADNPTIRITQEDQTKAQSALLRVGDFGAGWTGGPVKPSKLSAPSCPGFNPKESDLVVSGHAEARFSYGHGAVILDQDTQVLESADAVAQDFSRSVGPKLPDCLAYQLKNANKALVSNAVVKEISFPKVGSVSVAYRAVITTTQNGHRGRFIRDFVFFGQGRFEFSIVVDAPSIDAAQVVPFEQAMVQILVRRSKSSSNVA
jgi:hypothetical protein